MSLLLFIQKSKFLLLNVIQGIRISSDIEFDSVFNVDLLSFT